jgi:hypothetical protein
MKRLSLAGLILLLIYGVAYPWPWGGGGGGGGTPGDNTITSAMILDNTIASAKMLDNTLLGGKINSAAALPNGVTATSQSANDNSTKIATTRYVDRADDLKANISRTKTFSFGFDGVAATDNVLLWRAPVAVTITRADCYASVDNVVGNLMECATDNVTSCTVLDAWTITNAVSPFTDSSMTDGAVAAGAWIRWSTTSVGTTGNRLTCTVQYNE